MGQERQAYFYLLSPPSFILYRCKGRVLFDLDTARRRIHYNLTTLPPMRFVEKKKKCFIKTDRKRSLYRIDRARGRNFVTGNHLVRFSAVAARHRGGTLLPYFLSPSTVRAGATSTLQ